MDMKDIEGNVKPAAEMKLQPGAFASAVEGIKGPGADEEAQIRAMFQNVTMDNLNDQVQIPAALPSQTGQLSVNQPVVQQQPAEETKRIEIPQKFQKPDGTVDEEKLKASTQALEQAIDKKQTTIEEALAKYKELEKKQTELGNQAKQLPTAPPISTPTLLPPQQTGLDPNLEQVRMQLLELQKQDPIAFAVEIAKAVSRKEASEIARPALDVVSSMAEKQKDETMRANLASLAEKDSRIMNPELYQAMMEELQSDPAYFRLKNPHKAAWNEVKERLRLGEPSQVQAQPSTPGPTLGRGAPPSVSSLPSTNGANAFAMASDPRLNPRSADGSKLEEAYLKQLAESAWRG